MEVRYYETYYQQETRHWWFRWRFRLIRDVINNLSGMPDRPTMLDAGCGTGQMLKMLQQHGPAVGLDLSEDAIMFASSRDAENLVLGSVTKPPFADGTFDIAFALDVIEHVDDDRGMLEGLRELVRPGGALVVTVPAFQSLWSDHDKINHHRRRYRRRQMRKTLMSAGFEVERITYCNTFLFPVVWVTRRAQALVRRFRPKDETQVSSDLHAYPRVVNALLYRLMLVEAWIVRHVNLPIGVSILAIARRPFEPAANTARVADDVAIEQPVAVGAR
jgi:2-polyprenyl-3-methyl-5-hydroxy-6-metoxy-1,4-benzoquinol methylase